MAKLLLAASLTVAGLMQLVENNVPTAPNLVSGQAIITVESKHDHSNDPPSLNREDVMAFERGERLRVTDLERLQGENAGLELFLLIDDASRASLGSQLGDLRHFIQSQPAATSIGIGYMRNGTVSIVQNLTTEHSHAANALRLPLSSEGVMASPYLSFRDLLKRWRSSSVRREVVLVTSGVDSLAGPGPMNPYVDGAIEDAQRQGIVVFAIYTPAAGHAGHSFWRINWAQNHLARIAEETGGEAYMLGTAPPVSFSPYLDEITARLARQYRVTFLMKPQAKGGFRSIRFTTEVPNVEIVAPSGVYAPANRDEPER